METSIFLAKVIGLVSVMISAAVLVRYKTSRALEDEAVKNPATACLASTVSRSGASYPPAEPTKSDCPCGSHLKIDAGVGYLRRSLAAHRVV